MNPSPTTLGQLVRSRRLALGLTQQKLADAVGWRSVAFVSDVENDVRHVGEEYFPKLAEALGVPQAEIEALDTRTAVRETKELIRRSPEYAPVLRRVVDSAKSIDADELTRRIEKMLEDDPPPERRQ